MRLQVVVISLVVSLLATADVCMFGSALPAGAADQAEASPVNLIYSNLETLVRDAYPRAKMQRSGDTLHFEFKVKKQLGFSGQTVLAPDQGGILGDIELKNGGYTGKDKDRLPSEIIDGFHTTLVMAPYSSSAKAHLLAKLTFPADLPVEFKEKFKESVNQFNAGEKNLSSGSEETEALRRKATPVAMDEAADTSPFKLLPGPLMEERETVYGEIQEAEKKDIGVAPYEAELRSIQKAALAGEPVEPLRSRLKSLASSLADQIIRPKPVAMGQSKSAQSSGRSGGASDRPAASGDAPGSSKDPRAIRLAQAIVSYGLHGEYTKKVIKYVFGGENSRLDGDSVSAAFKHLDALHKELKALGSDVNVEYGKGCLAVFRVATSAQCDAARKRGVRNVSPYLLADRVVLCTF